MQYVRHATFPCHAKSWLKEIGTLAIVEDPGAGERSEFTGRTSDAHPGNMAARREQLRELQIKLLGLLTQLVALLRGQ